MQNKEENHQSFRWNDCLIKLSFFLQFLSFVLSGIAFFAPFWYIELNSEIREGLWGRCDKLLECIWFHERSFEKSLPGEYIVTGCCGFDSHHRHCHICKARMCNGRRHVALCLCKRNTIKWCKIAICINAPNPG